MIVTDSHGCSTSINDTIKSNSLFVANAFGDTVIINENSTVIGVTLNQTGSYTYSWLPDYSTSNPYSSSTTASPSTTTTYIVTVIEDGTGCLNSDSVVVVVLPTTYIFIPNAFTPNNDGYNDLFQLIKGEIVTIEDVQIFNRWGQLVYRQPDLNWDGINREGIPCGMGAYTYYVVYSIQGDATTYRKVGDVTLVK